MEVDEQEVSVNRAAGNRASVVMLIVFIDSLRFMFQTRLVNPGHQGEE